MTAPIDALLAELAASELECRELSRASLRAQGLHGEDSFEAFDARKQLHRAIGRQFAAQKAMVEFSLTWAAERAQSFVTPANDTPDGKLTNALDDAFAPLRGMR